MFLPALPCLRRLKQAMVVVLPEGFRSLKRTLARLDPDEKLTISVIYPCFPWFSFDALGLFYESRLALHGGHYGFSLCSCFPSLTIQKNRGTWTLCSHCYGHIGLGGFISLVCLLLPHAIYFPIFGSFPHLL